MKLTDFLKDRGMLLLLHLVCMCMTAFFFRLTNYSLTNTVLFLTMWVILLTVWLAVTFLQRRRFFREAERILEKVDQRYLLGELFPDSFRLEDRLYREMIRCSNKSCIERIRRVEDDKKDYREYIESWVHEIKAPITGIELLCANRRNGQSVETQQGMRLSAEGPYSAEDLRTISMENRKIENCVERILYYARSEEVYRDFMIREVCLEDMVCEVLERNRLLLIQNDFKVEVSCRDTVYTDEKWIAFILNQIVLNSVKYRGESPVLSIRSRRERNGVMLELEDNGTGIRKEELSRIFEKGFTGSNGRAREGSTGMGLYLCRRLCDRLGIGLSADSRSGVGTRLTLEFPVSNYICNNLEEWRSEKED